MKVNPMQPIWLYEGELHHCRHSPRKHQFSQSVYYFSLNLNLLNHAANKLFSIDRWNLFSFFSKDHARSSQKKNTESQDLRPWAQASLSAAGIEFKPDSIYLTCFPRVLGYAFNPISLWYCYDKSRILRAVICEVNNTFGETHNYVIAHKDLAEIKDTDWFTSDKVFHVSPFFPVSGRYEFRFLGSPINGEKLHVSIVYFESSDAKKPIFDSQLKMSSKALSAGDLPRLLFSYPLLTVYVVGNIHFQALKLWFKKAKFFRKPAPPEHLNSGSVAKN